MRKSGQKWRSNLQTMQMICKTISNLPKATWQISVGPAAYTATSLIGQRQGQRSQGLVTKLPPVTRRPSPHIEFSNAALSILQHHQAADFPSGSVSTMETPWELPTRSFGWATASVVIANLPPPLLEAGIRLGPSAPRGSQTLSRKQWINNNYTLHLHNT